MTLRISCAHSILFRILHQRRDAILFVLPILNDANPAEREYACNRAERLPSVPRLSPALLRLAIEIGCGGALDSSLILGKVRRVDQWLLDELLLAKDTSNGLVVNVFGELEEHRVEEGGSVFLIGLGGH